MGGHEQSMEAFKLEDFDSYKEDNRREVKKAKGGLPVSLWDTYSAFANCTGGVIILGVREKDDKHWETTGLLASDTEKLIKDFWDNANNPKKVSINLLTDDDVCTYEIAGDLIIVIKVPSADRVHKPVFINDNLFGGTFRRNGEGDYHCTPQEVRAMLRDVPEETSDMKILEDMDLSVIDMESFHAFRNRHKVWRPGHVWEADDDDEYLRKIGGAAFDKKGRLHPTAAGLLMFGREYDIVREFPEYFLDYRETLDPLIRWTDRLQSSSGNWTGNVMDFFFRVNSKILKDIKIPFEMDGQTRVDDTPVAKALREALVNCLVNADYFISRGVVVKKDRDTLVLENPGSIRTGKEQMLKGGISDPRNKTLLKMFNLIGYGERAGSGVPDIYSVWAAEGWNEPVVEEQYNPDRTVLTLSFRRKSAIKIGDKKSAIKKSAIKTVENFGKIRRFLLEKGESKTEEIASEIGLSVSRTRELLSLMEDIESMGKNRGRRYRLRE
ncbi:MAG: putative DNA binding domain-containing protein [Victivallales bacterium]|nr:putative DNA binding domain-containing protein [Victivallales bacterium]